MVVETGNECGGEFIMNGGPYYESLLAEVYNEATTSTASQRIKTYSPHHLQNGLTTQRVPLPISNGDEVVMAKRGSSSVHQLVVSIYANSDNSYIAIYFPHITPTRRSRADVRRLPFSRATTSA
eukprot:6320310-Pyramimonas_sp.AAC.3